MQSRNSYADLEIKFNGKTQLLRSWATELKLNYTTVRMRYARGTRGRKLFAPTSVNAKPIDLRMFLGNELYELIEQKANHLQVAPSTLVRHLLQQSL